MAVAITPAMNIEIEPEINLGPTVLASSPTTVFDFGNTISKAPPSPSKKVLSLPRPIQWSPCPRAVLGVIQIATDLVMDLEGALLVAQLPQVEIRFTKIALHHEEICAATYLEAFEAGTIQSAIDSLSLPRTNPQTSKDYITQWGISCTSMSFTLGRERLMSCFPVGAPMTDMWQGVLAALAALELPGARRLGVLTPYMHSVSATNHELLENEGYTVAASISLDLSRDVETSAVAPDYILECCDALVDAAEVDAIFIGCSAFRACMPGFVDRVEAKVGVPVVTSTQAFLWHMLREAGVQDSVAGYGHLFRL